MANLAQTQNNEQSQLYDTIHQTYGDNQVATDAYNAALQQLITTQNAETQATQQQIAITQAQGLAGLLATEATNASEAGINGLSTSLAAFDAKAADSRLEFIQAWTNYYGQAAAGSQDLQDQLLIMDKATAAQRLQVQQSYSDASVAALKTAHREPEAAARHRTAAAAHEHAAAAPHDDALSGWAMRASAIADEMSQRVRRGRRP